MYDVYHHCLNKSEVILSLLDIDVSLKMLNFIHIDVVIPSFISFLPHISKKFCQPPSALAYCCISTLKY